jgi:alpha-L-rhamnosidase
LRTAFLVDADESDVGTPGRWEVARVEGWTFGRWSAGMTNFYVEVGPEERLDAGKVPDVRRVPWLESLGWREPVTLIEARPRGSRWESLWALVPRSLPPMEYRRRMVPARTAEGAVMAASWQRTLDFGELLCAYPRFELHGPPGTAVEIAYDEALWLPQREGGAYGLQRIKGVRGDVAGKESIGYADRVVLGPGGAVFEPLWWRTFRYMTLRAAEEIEVRVEIFETGYPYSVESSFEADDPAVAPIWEAGVRTVRRCAGEGYFDCPYYEQLQYVADTRIQAMIHAYLSRDRALARNAAEQFAWSIGVSGLTQSRYPNRTAQYIPGFSLWYLLFLEDRLRYDPEPSIPVTLGQIDGILEAFEATSTDAERAQHWVFMDWTPGWPYGQPPGGAGAVESRLLLELARLAARALRRHLRGEVDGSCMGGPPPDLVFEPTTGLVRTEAGGASEHAEALVRLLGRAAGAEVIPWPDEKVLEQARAARASLYFRHYVDQAQLPADYLAHLDPWRRMLALGLTTFAETEEPARSDCHGWSAHPLLGFFQIVAGVTSAANGWARARVEPRPGRLRRFDARIAHPLGELRVVYRDDGLELETPVPTDVVWRGRAATVAPGRYRWAGGL